MANFVVTHHRFPRNPHIFTVNVTKIVKKGGEVNPNFKPSYPSAEPYWELTIHTTGLGSGGDSVGPVIVDVIGSETTVNDLINSKIAELCSLIDWSEQGEFSEESDVSSPIIVSRIPSPGQTDVPIQSSVIIRVQDKLPANGIDAGTLSLKIDGIAVNPEIVGNKYDYTFVFKPRPIYTS